MGWGADQHNPLDTFHLESSRAYMLVTCFCVVKKCRFECISASETGFGVQNSF